ncbi:methyl-accepting chemotaxis protein [Brachyspira pilosicoli]|uniref:methyl-accepting chemotaxis protein n=1 Tax=Brachyspira pilosicoli TaxID=52584 RepID=UPI001C932536|nr:methyl-accepting chemotaxis protein [Brachyspira pilosicoli]MBW5397085.1 methyl-accepting chemotaxis protein [Brachyspira pilosicoli]
MSIRLRITLMIFAVMAFVAISSNFLSSNLNIETFYKVIDDNMNNNFKIIANNFENKFYASQEEVNKLSYRSALTFNTVDRRTDTYLNDNASNFLMQNINESNPYIDRMLSILFIPNYTLGFNELPKSYNINTKTTNFTIITNDANGIWSNLNTYSPTDVYYKTFLSSMFNRTLFNISKTIIENNTIIGVANVALFFDYTNTSEIKNIFDIDSSELLIINKNDLTIINSKDNRLNKSKLDIIYPVYYQLFNSNLAKDEIVTENVNIYGKDYRVYIKSISDVLNIVMLIPNSYYDSQISYMNRSIVYTIIMVFVISAIIIGFFIKLIFSSLTRISDIVGDSINNKDLSVDIPELSGGDEVSEITRWMGILSGNFQATIASIKKIISISKKQSDRFTNQISSNADIINNINDSIENIKTNINEELNNLEIVENSNKNILEYIDINSNNIDEIDRDTKELQEKIIKEGDSIDQISVSVEQMSKTIEGIDNIIFNASNKAKELHIASMKSKEKMQATSTATSDLRNALGFISNFVSSIRNIAHQTNLLAMNAAIEAAHAGKYSSGFAVVAEEIRKLSEVSNEQADNANKVLQTIEEKIIVTSNDLTESTAQFDMLARDVQEVTEIMGSVHNSSVEQLKAINEIVNSITTISSSSDNIKKQYINVASKLGDIKNNINTLNTLSVSASKSMAKLRTTSNAIYENIDKIYSNSNELSTYANTMTRFANDNNKILTDLNDEISKYTINTKSSSATTTQRVRGISLIILKDFVREKFGEDGYQKWLTAMEPASSLIFKNDISIKEWYPFMAGFHNPHKLVCDLFYDGDNAGIRDIAEYHYSRLIPKYFNIILLFVPRYYILRYVAEVIFKEIHDPVRIEVIKSRKRLLVAHMKNFTGNPEILELSLMAWSSLLLGSITHVKSSLEITKSIKDGELYTEFVLKW